MSCRTSCCKTLLLAIAVLVIAALATSAFAQQLCMQAEYKANPNGGNQKLQCTANDVSIAYADNPRDLSGKAFGNGYGCPAGQYFSFIADFHIVTTATARENIGLYFQTQGQTSAVTGTGTTCSDNIIAPPHLASGGEACLGSGGTATGVSTCYGAGTYEELDSNEPYSVGTSTTTGGTTGCGDISTADNNQVVTVEVDNVLCQAGANGNLLLPNAVSWQQPGGTIMCTSSGSSYPFNANAIPGSPSKCNHNDLFTVPIQVQSPTVSVSKTCDIGSGASSSCDFGATNEGGTVTYSITVSNTSSFGTLTLKDICDTYYGTIALASGYTAQSCWGTGSPAGTPNTGNSNTCSLPQTLQPAGQSGASYSCQFTANQGENATVKDIAYGYGVGQDGVTPFSNHSTQVTVTSGEAPSAATVTKSWISTTAACATVRYKVDVANTSGTTSDELLTLSRLTDDTYDLSSLTVSGTPVVGTTCGVSAGQGTLMPVCNTGTGVCTSGALKTGLSSCSQASDCQLPGGTYSTISPGGTDYICYFDAQFCGNIGNDTTCGGNGISHTDTVVGTLSGDEAESLTPSGQVTVHECINTIAQ